MHFGTWGFGALVVVTIVLSAVVVSDHIDGWKKKREAKKRVGAAGFGPDASYSALSSYPPPYSPSGPSSGGGTNDQGSQATIPVAEAEGAEVEDEREPEPDLVGQFRDCLDRLVGEGKTLDEAFMVAFEEAGKDLSLDDALAEVAGMDYKPADIITLMEKKGRSVGAIVRYLEDRDDFSVGELVVALAPMAEGATLKEKADNALEAIKSVWDLDGEGEALIESLGKVGCSREEVAELVFHCTSMTLADIVLEMGLANDPACVAALDKALEAGISDPDDYRTLREGDVEFEGAASILKACGKGAAEILDAENEYSSMGLDSTEDVIGALSKAGFTLPEILDGVWESEFTSGEGAGATVEAFLSANVSTEDILELLTQKDVDPETLDDELSETDVDLRVRVGIVYHLFESLDRAHAKKEA